MNEEQDERLRKEFSKVLDAPRAGKDFGYAYERERVVYSWEEIFCEIGKLLAVGRCRHPAESIKEHQ